MNNSKYLLWALAMVAGVAIGLVIGQAPTTLDAIGMGFILTFGGLILTVWILALIDDAAQRRATVNRSVVAGLVRYGFGSDRVSFADAMAKSRAGHDAERTPGQFAYSETMAPAPVITTPTNHGRPLVNMREALNRLSQTTDQISNYSDTTVSQPIPAGVVGGAK